MDAVCGHACSYQYFEFTGNRYTKKYMHEQCLNTQILSFNMHMYGNHLNITFSEIMPVSFESKWRMFLIFQNNNSFTSPTAHSINTEYYATPINKDT